MDDTVRIDLAGDDEDDLVSDGASALELLRDRVAQTRSKDDPVWPVPRRDGIKVRYSVNLTPAKLNKMIQRCTDKRSGTIDTDSYSAMILATQCTGIFIDGQLVEDEGRALTLHDRVIIDLFGGALKKGEAPRAVDAVKRLYGATEDEPDGYALDVQNHSNALLQAAGFGERFEEDDETLPPGR